MRQVRRCSTQGLNELSLLPTAPPQTEQLRRAIAVPAALFVAFVITAPFGWIQLPRWPSFIAGFQAVLFVNDLITATLLFAHFSLLCWRSLLVLASGYLFTSLIAITFAIAFPGVFSPTGLFGPQTPAWLYHFWHCGLTLAVIAYIFLNWVDCGADVHVDATTSTSVCLHEVYPQAQ